MVRVRGVLDGWRAAAVPAMRVVQRRVDAITIAYRVDVDPGFVGELHRASSLALRYGRACLEWRARVKVDAEGRRIGEVATVPPAWSDEARDDDDAEIREGLVIGECRYSRASKVWNVINEGFFRLHVDLVAPGAVERFDDRTGELIREAGWTIEIVWYAQRIAEWGLTRVLAESRALAWQLGTVHEERLRRLDMCADVAGWEIKEDDLQRLVKRPRASVRSDSDDTAIGPNGRARRPSKLGELAGTTGHETGFAAKRKITGITIGRGAMLARVYNKRIELAYSEERRYLEEDRWHENGWDGVEPVTRIEFQIRGTAIAELGLRDPRACLETVLGERDKAVGQRVAHDADGCPIGLPDRLDWIWSTCLGWARLVVPPVAGQRVYASRLPDDPRWALLREIRWTGKGAPPLRRFRVRRAASEAQALGVNLSIAAKAGELGEAWSQSEHAYDASEAEHILRDRVVSLSATQAERMIAWLLQKCGDPVRACVHLAVRHNAARARFFPWEGVFGNAPRRESETEADRARARGGAPRGRPLTRRGEPAVSFFS